MNALELFDQVPCVTGKVDETFDCPTLVLDGLEWKRCPSGSVCITMVTFETTGPWVGSPKDPPGRTVADGATYLSAKLAEGVAIAFGHKTPTTKVGTLYVRESWRESHDTDRSHVWSRYGCVIKMPMAQ